MKLNMVICKKMTHLIRLVFVTLLIGSLGSKTSLGELRIDITQGTIKPMPIAVTDLVGNTAEERKIGKDITRIISADLERSGLFNPISKKAFIQKMDAAEALPRFGDWRVINAQAMVHGRAQILSDGRLRVEFRLWDVFAERQMV